ncbi:hypothetical protein SNOG_14302 [Parastagonospora nodorum SN15]|uniref:Uncharacterized protein n=1 Tax=Phaeosphaeria nodorum (strain SN15 / ATCC MYA-4574 / FGSC 10173) TaxID=321614 RepID=Q0U1C0_PHANO|nr:hypothetical protein SNOG_14302 [Parastagonospora nodorum SN15]EAT78173.1 hypothetical protein SNOG_14302 [Parastagonospora nodorum SN15]
MTMKNFVVPSRGPGRERISGIPHQVQDKGLRQRQGSPGQASPGMIVASSPARIG